MDSLLFKIIDLYFKDNPNNLVLHHLESYNYFMDTGIKNIFRENNPIRFIERIKEDKEDEHNNECLLYLGGKNGDKIYYGKPIIYDENNTHFMYPNDARLRNMTYGITIHYDVEIEMTYYVNGELKKYNSLIEKVYLGKIPLMLKSNLCILNGLTTEVRSNLGECKHDYGGYFIIDGKEKSIIPQEKFANNMLYIRKYKDDELYSYSAEIRSVSEDTSKPIRTTGIKIVSPTSLLSNNQIVVSIPNVRIPIPLFILMRALGITSDKAIIETCLLNLEENKSYIDLFIPSVHDANKIFNQETALKYIASFTKRKSVSGVLEILINYFLPHIGEMNLLDKAYYVGYMVYRLLRVFTKEDKPTDRDNFRFKRIEQTGQLLYELFREYYLIQKRAISLAIDNEHYYHTGKYKDDDFVNLIESNYREIFKERIVDTGIRKAFKGNWGAQTHTKRVGVVQDLNRLSWNSFISQLRKLNLPLDSSAKVVGPRLLHGSQWGFIDPVDTPDGGNIGLHKHLAITTYITSGYSSYPIIKWMRKHVNLKLLQESLPLYIFSSTKVFVNGNWVGIIDNPLQVIELFKLHRRIGIIPVFTSISFDYNNEINIYTDGGRLCRPIYYIENGIPSYNNEVIELLKTNKITWENLISGWSDKKDKDFNTKKNKIYKLNELYENVDEDNYKLNDKLIKEKAIIDYIDASEEETSYIATSIHDLTQNKYYTNLEIDPSLLLGVMGNLIIYPENNPLPRNSFSCGQSKQAVSIYHSNFQNRIDKMGVILNYGQIPLIKSRYLEYINKEEMPYGVNTIVAIMSYTGYNVEDAILINQGSVNRGLFRTTYFSMYEAREESSKVTGGTTNTVFADISKENVSGLKPGYDYSHLDKWGLVKENTPLDDKIIVIGKMSRSMDLNSDSSVKPKKGQLGFVDKSFITEGEEGFRIAKIRIREERIPAIGDKMASRAGQKGTIGLIIPEEDMPFTQDGIRPDIIINPHALPSRMTIGQLVETLFGKACTIYGGFGDCTSFASKGSKIKEYGELLSKVGFHSSGNQLLYSGMTGEQIHSDIFIGPTYYMRLKHMVKDKINYRAQGPRTALTRQSVHGRANDGGLRIGEMERDAIISHGASMFLNDSFLKRADEYYMAICNKTGMISIYNTNKNIFLSPSADGPVKFYTTMDGKQNLEMISKFGRSFSLLRIPYSFKLLIQELQVLNIQMRIITDDNIDQLMNMSFTDNIIDLSKDILQKTEEEIIDKDKIKIEEYINKYKNYIINLNKKNQPDYNKQYVKNTNISETNISIPVNREIKPIQQSQDINIPTKRENNTSIQYPPEETDNSSLDFNRPLMLVSIDFGSDELNNFYKSLPIKIQKKISYYSTKERVIILKELFDIQKKKDINPPSILSTTQTSTSKTTTPSIFNVEEPIKIKISDNNENNIEEITQDNTEDKVKKVTFNT